MREPVGAVWSPELKSCPSKVPTTEWVFWPFHVHDTVVPALTLKLLGEKALSMIATADDEPAAVIAARRQGTRAKTMTVDRPNLRPRTGASPPTVERLSEQPKSPRIEV